MRAIARCEWSMAVIPAIEWKAAVEVMGERDVGCRLQPLSDIK